MSIVQLNVIHYDTISNVIGPNVLHEQLQMAVDDTIHYCLATRPGIK